MALAGRSAAPVPAADAVASADHLDYLIRVYAEESGIEPGLLHPRTPLENYGLTSALITALNARLASDIGDHVPRTLFFEHPDLAGVAGELARLDSRTGLAPTPAATGARRRAAGEAPRRLAPAPGADQRIAIIGLAGRYPQAADLEELWSNLRDGRDSVTALPRERRQPDWPDWPAGLMVGGFIDGVADFDPLFFGITPRDAALMDPQERLFLQVAWHALESAGYTRGRLAAHDGRVGVFVGSMYNEYPLLGIAAARDGRWTATGSAPASPTGCRTSWGCTVPA